MVRFHGKFHLLGHRSMENKYLQIFAVIAFLISGIGYLWIGVIGYLDSSEKALRMIGVGIIMLIGALASAHQLYRSRQAFKSRRQDH